MEDRSREVFAALGDVTRIKILELLKNEELCVSDICARFNITQPSVSHHLQVLKRAGLVNSNKRGREVYYSFDREAMIKCCGKQFRVFDLNIVKR